MSDKDSMSGSDMELDDITEGAEIRVVQSSIHASILQQSLFKVIENKTKCLLIQIFNLGNIQY